MYDVCWYEIESCHTLYIRSFLKAAMRVHLATSFFLTSVRSQIIRDYLLKCSLTKYQKEVKHYSIQCYNSSWHRNAWRVAKLVWIEANYVAYGSFVRVYRMLMTDDSRRNHFTTRAFRQCCCDEELGEYGLRQLCDVAKLHVIIDDKVSYQYLPSSWTCNVKDRKRWKSDGQFGRKENVRP